MALFDRFRTRRPAPAAYDPEAERRQRLAEVRRRCADALVEIRRVERLRAERVRGVVELRGQASRALAAGQDGEAWQVLHDAVGAEDEVSRLDDQLAQLRAEADGLLRAEAALQARTWSSEVYVMSGRLPEAPRPATGILEIADDDVTARVQQAMDALRPPRP